MKKSNKFISLVLAVLALFVLFCSSLSASAEITDETQKTTVDPYFTNATTCTCPEHMDFYTTTELVTEPGFSLGDDDMEKVSEIGKEVKGAVGVLHKIFAKIQEFLTMILENIGNIGGGFGDFLS